MSNRRDDRKSTSTLARRLATASKFVVAALGVMAVAVGFSLQPSSPLASGLFFGVGTSLLAYVLTAWIHAWTAEAATLEAMQSSVSAIVTDIFESVQQQTYSLIAKEFPKFIPLTFFAATKGRNFNFERELRKAIAESRHYTFRGVTGRHVPIWLDEARTSDLQATVLVLHPQNRDLIVLYIKEKIGSSTQIDPEQISAEAEEVKDQILYSIVALFDARHNCPITVKIHNGPIFFRSEIFDQKCFVSFYVDDLATNYPTTYVYDSNSLFYATFCKDVGHCLQTETSSIVFTSRTTESALKKFLKEVGYAGELQPLRDKFAAFRAAFAQPDTPQVRNSAAPSLTSPADSGQQSR